MAAAELSVEVVYSPRAGEVLRVSLRLPEGTTVREAIEASGLFDPPSGWEHIAPRPGVWGCLTAPGDRLRDQDRVELCRGLLVDPKEARRLRHSDHRKRTKPRR